VTGKGMKEIGYYRTGNANSWSAKTPWINPRTGDFYLYGNDMNRGLDIYKFSGAAGKSESKKAGTWLTPAQATARALARPKTSAGIETSVYCLLTR